MCRWEHSTYCSGIMSIFLLCDFVLDWLSELLKVTIIFILKLTSSSFLTSQ